MAVFIPPAAPCYFSLGANWVDVPNVRHVGLSCHADDTVNARGRQFVRGCPYLLGDHRIQSGLRVDSEVLIL
eukprot:4470502-Pyramimonas_sp.AAC.1